VLKTLFQKKNVLVLGGAGFIGSHLCDELVRSNKVICVDNFLTGSERNIDHLLQNPNFAFIRHDITLPLALNAEDIGLKKFKAAWQGVQEVYFLASPASRGDIERLPVETMMVNSVGLKNALDIAVENKAKFCYISSDAIYGYISSNKELIKENAEGIIKHIDDHEYYAISQRFGESLVENYRRHRNLEVRIARVFNTYGPRMKLDSTRVISEFTRKIILGKDVVVYGGSGVVGSFCHVYDTVKGLIRLMEAGNEQPVNIGSDQPVSMTELVKQISEIVGTGTEVIIRPDFPDGYKPQLVPNISRAKEELGWFPVTLLAEGLRSTIEDLKANQGLIELGFSDRVS